MRNEGGKSKYNVYISYMAKVHLIILLLCTTQTYKCSIVHNKTYIQD